MAPLRVPDWLSPWSVRAIHAGARWIRPLTVGVRAAVFDGSGRVFLVRHSYVAGWHLPGGAVEPGETVGDALRRELREEAGLLIEGEPTILGVFFNRAVSRRDHVIVFVVRQFRAAESPKADWEIVEKGFFALDQLPSETTSATRARLGEIPTEGPRSPDW